MITEQQMMVISKIFSDDQTSNRAIQTGTDHNRDKERKRS